MLFKLVSRIDREEFQAEVVSLTDIGPVGERIQALGIPVRALGMRRRVPNPIGALLLAGWARRAKPDVIQTWMYHADLIGGIAGKLAGRIPTVWNIRHTDLAVDRNRRSTVWTAAVCARTSAWLPRRIVCCSEASRRVHEAFGYARDRMLVIPNGFDTETFTPDPTARESVRKELGVPPQSLLIGVVARFDPQKDHRNFVRAAGRLHSLEPEVHFLLCGSGIASSNSELMGWIREARIADHCHLLGLRDDVPRLTAALDIATSASIGEGFPNVIGEAMACEIPPAATDVGDTAWLVSDSGRVVPPQNPEALANAWLELIRIGHDARQRLGVAARRRIETWFDLQTVVDRYETLYTELATRRNGDR